MYKVVVFDMDGTILDTLTDLHNTLVYTLEQIGMKTCTYEDTRSYVGNGIRKTIERALPADTNDAVIDRALGIFMEHYKEHCYDYTRPYEGICELINDLRRKGYKTAVVSNKANSAVKILCERFFDGLFDVYIGEKPNVNRKPAPDLVYEALDALGACKGDAVYIGDSEVDKQTADNSGLDFIGVSWGFRGKDFLIQQGAAVIADSPKDVLNILDVSFPNTVYVADVSPLYDESVYSKWLERIPYERLKKASKYKNQADRARSVGAAALLMMAYEDLIERYKLALPKILPDIATGKKGKPFFVKSPVHFSLSHSGDRVICMFSIKAAGCDVEYKHSDAVKIAKRFFTDAEYSILLDTESEQGQIKLFDTIWTLKESVVKASGDGLSIPLDSFSVIDEAGHAAIKTFLPHDNNTYYLHSYDCMDEYGYGCASLSEDYASDIIMKSLG